MLFSPHIYTEGATQTACVTWTRMWAKSPTTQAPILMLFHSLRFVYQWYILLKFYLPHISITISLFNKNYDGFAIFSKVTKINRLLALTTNFGFLFVLVHSVPDKRKITRSICWSNRVDLIVNPKGNWQNFLEKLSSFNMCKISTFYWKKCWKWIGFEDPIRIEWKESWIWNVFRSSNQLVQRRSWPRLHKQNENQMNFFIVHRPFDYASLRWKRNVSENVNQHTKGRALLDHLYSCSTLTQN